MGCDEARRVYDAQVDEARKAHRESGMRRKSRSARIWPSEMKARRCCPSGKVAFAVSLPRHARQRVDNVVIRLFLKHRARAITSCFGAQLGAKLVNVALLGSHKQSVFEDSWTSVMCQGSPYLELGVTPHLLPGTTNLDLTWLLDSLGQVGAK